MANLTTNLDQMTVQQSGKEAMLNSLLDAASPATSYGRRASTTGGLTWGHYGGTVLLNGVATQSGNGTILLSASSTNYIELSAAGAVYANTTGFTPGRIPLYTATTSATAITSYTDHRSASMTLSPGYSDVAVSSANVTLSSDEALCRILEITGVMTASLTVFCPDREFEYVVWNNTSGAFELTFSTLSGAGVKIPQGERCTVISDGANALLVSSAGLLKRVSKSVDGAANVTLNANEYSAGILEFTGAITANIQVIVPLESRQWTVFNNTTGAFTVTVIGATGTGIVVGQTKRAIVYSDGTNVVRATADV